MPVSGVSESGSGRVEQAQSERRAEDAQAAENRRRIKTEENRETRSASEKGRGENMDVTA